jgi:hypothetical protein
MSERAEPLPFIWVETAFKWVVESPCGWRIVLYERAPAQPYIWITHVAETINNVNTTFRNRIYESDWATPASTPEKIAILHAEGSRTWSEHIYNLNEEIERRLRSA